jgi:hypothetical protein
VTVTGMICRSTTALFWGSLLVSCQGDTTPLTKGYTWVTRDIPPPMAGTVARYEETQFFGERSDPHGWRMVVRFTLRGDAPGGAAGCSFVEWIPGTWSQRGSLLAVGTPSADSGSLEMYACPDGSPPSTVRSRPSHFVEAQSPYRLEGLTLRLERQFGAEPPYAVVLTRIN